jgi:hypothetical protein
MINALTRSFPFPLALVLSISISAASAAPVAPGITFDATHVVATGFHSGRDVVIFGVGSAPGPYFSRQLRFIDTVVADAAGAVRYEIPEGVPDHSIWFAIDAQTRDYAVAAPHAAQLRPSLRAPIVHSALDAGKDAIDLDRRLMDLLLVRPGEGAWIGSCGRNSRKDLNRGKSGAMQLSAAQLIAAPRSSGRPDTILPSDLVIIIDSETLEYFVGSPRQP